MPVMPMNKLDKTVKKTKPATRKKPPATATAPRTTKPRATAKKAIKAVPPQPSASLQHRLTLMGIEVLVLTAGAVGLIIILLGYSASRFSGTAFFSSLLPFAMGILIVVLVAAVFLIVWWRVRAWLHSKTLIWAPAAAALFFLATGVWALQDDFSQALGHFIVLVGGKQEAGRVTLAHQVFAAYRRYDNAQLQKLVDRAQAFSPAIEEAAKAFDVDRHLLYGLAATESSFLPRDSKDGGRGLFQITLVPKNIMSQAARRLSVSELSLTDPRHNAFVAAATFKFYLEQMRGDLFLGLLAYNIGPANGGLRFIMQQYGATDFITIQPYLQQLPRDYPVRVLSYALAFKLWQNEGKLPAYEEGNNAVRIQRLGIPGL